MTAIVSEYGELLMIMQAPDDVIKLNTPLGARAVSDPPHRDMYYSGGWHEFPPRPSEHHVFNYHSLTWIDSRELSDVRQATWIKIKSERDQLEFGGFEYEGNIYDSDQVSQGRIMGAAVAGIDQVWTLAVNTTVELSASQLQQLYAALQAHVASVHERGRIARQLINEAETKEEVEAVQL